MTTTFAIGDKVRLGLGKTIWTVEAARDRTSENSQRRPGYEIRPSDPRRWQLTIRPEAGVARRKFVFGCDVNKITEETATRLRADLAREADRPLGHCQVCDREIGVKAGVIAHHGYQRPWHRSGVQTASCNGARYKPYELERTVLGREITLLQDAIASHEARLAKQHAEHPPLVKREARYNRRTNEHVPAVMIAKGGPDTWSSTWEDGSVHLYDPYDDVEQSWLRQMGWELKALRETLTHQQARWDTWKAPK